MANSILDDSKFWEALTYLLNMEDKVELSFVEKKLKVDAEYLQKVLGFLQEMNCEFKKNVIAGKTFLIPPKEKPVIKFEFNLIDWLKFQAHFPLLHGFSGKPFHQGIVDKLASIEEKYKRFDLYRGLKVFEKFGTLVTGIPFKKGIAMQSDESDSMNVVSEEKPDEKKMVIEKALELHQCLCIKTHEHSEIVEVFPHRLVHLEGGLSLIGEEVVDRSLIYLPLNKMEKITIVKEVYEDPAFTKIDIDDFIENIRVINGNEIRLVLKIVNPENAHELNPLYHYLRKPYVISNPKGDLIWAASIEECTNLYEWLSNLTTKVEILDPVSFKKNFLDYCEKKLKKIA